MSELRSKKRVSSCTAKRRHKCCVSTGSFCHLDTEADMFLALADTSSRTPVLAAGKAFSSSFAMGKPQNQVKMERGQEQSCVADQCPVIQLLHASVLSRLRDRRREPLKSHCPPAPCSITWICHKTELLPTKNFSLSLVTPPSGGAHAEARVQCSSSTPSANWRALKALPLRCSFCSKRKNCNPPRAHRASPRAPAACHPRLWPLFFVCAAPPSAQFLWATYWDSCSRLTHPRKNSSHRQEQERK